MLYISAATTSAAAHCKSGQLKKIFNAIWEKFPTWNLNLQTTVANIEAQDQDDMADKMPSLVDDGSLSPPSSPRANNLEKSLDKVVANKKPAMSRIRTAIGNSWIWKLDSSIFLNHTFSKNGFRHSGIQNWQQNVWWSQRW